MSLRARLLIGLVVVTAVGLIVAGVVTYAAERSFLIKRVDQELISNVHAFEDQVDSQFHLQKRPPGGPGSDNDFPDNPGGPGGPPFLPGGTYAIYRPPTGEPRTSIVLHSLSPPVVPASVPISTPSHPHLITVNSASGSSLQYRVIAKASDTGAGTLIVALPLNDVAQTLQRLRNIGLIVLASVLAILAALSWVVIRIGLRPLDRMGATAGAIAAGDLSRRVEDESPRTEVGRLAIALNAMLGQIERAFAERQASEDRLRRFLSDASHELRTPLTSIRGYAELYRMGAASSPQEAAKAMERIEREAARMGVLVEDLLALARLDELPVRRHERLDAAPLVRDAAEDARAAAPDREITALADGEQMVSGDSSQLRQVLANLTRNALTHTPAGTPIELSVERTGERVRIAVRDHGPGLPAGAGENVFERFWRAEGGRERGKAGAGLGLAIVAAIVEAHDGTISASNAPGGGAQFAIELPAAENY
ncbi:MAG TPA: HAMP domain-containing sensor histidine kinase [Solirubrobacteraceae bacterium]